MNLSTQFTISRNVRFVEKLLFTKNLSVMLKSGIPITQAIEIIKTQTKNTYFRKILTAIIHKIDNGETLSKALSDYPRIFDYVFIHLVEVGEQSGKLEENLEYLATQQKKSYDFRRTVSGALLYPGIILTTGIVVAGGISFFVMPQMVELFESLDIELPWTTKILLGVANFMKDYNIIVFVGIVFFTVALQSFLTLKSVKPYWHLTQLKAPVIGQFLQKVELALLSRNLGVMLRSGLTFPTSLEILGKSTGNLVYKSLIKRVQKGIVLGESFEETLEKIESPFVPLMFTKMVGVGERSGKLDESLLYLGDFFEDEVDSQAKNLGTVLEPIILLIIGLIVAFIAFSILSPIYELTGSIRK